MAPRAWPKARGAPADMVLTDPNMPVMDSLTLIRELRKLATFKGVPIVFLTTESDRAMKQQAKTAGATGWITKPFQQAQLLAVVRKLIGPSPSPIRPRPTCRKPENCSSNSNRRCSTWSAHRRTPTW